MPVPSQVILFNLQQRQRTDFTVAICFGPLQSLLGPTPLSFPDVVHFSSHRSLVDVTSGVAHPSPSLSQLSETLAQHTASVRPFKCFEKKEENGRKKGDRREANNKTDTTQGFVGSVVHLLLKASARADILFMVHYLPSSLVGPQERV